ncbi:MAG: aldo/keto reductase [Planctomycetia bacterium]|nr:aldo/keto reductase [Planctomycetia bacterium]
MQYVRLGKTEMQASVIAFGGWAAGGWMWGGTEEKDAIDAIHAALDGGVNLIDTAPVYGFGRSEEIVGKAIAGRSRDKILIATKCGLIWTKEAWPDGKGSLHFYTTLEGYGTPERFDYRVYKYLRPLSIRAEVERSLRRLKTDYIDLLQTHWQDETSSIAETMETLLKLRDEGKIRAIGASNTQVRHLEEYETYGGIDVVQERFSMLDRQIETNGVLDFAKQHGLTLLPYSPLCRGLLTGKLSPERRFGPGDRRDWEERFSPENRRIINAKLELLQPMAQAKGLTVPQLIVAWTFCKYPKTSVLCGARNAAQILENVRAGDTRLTDAEMREMEETLS